MYLCKISKVKGQKLTCCLACIGRISALELPPLNVVAHHSQWCNGGHAHEPFGAVLLGTWVAFRVSASKAVNGVQGSIRMPDWWMFCLFGRWLFKWTFSNEFVKRFLDKTLSNVFDRHAMTCTNCQFYNNCPGIPPKVAICKLGRGNTQKNVEKCLTNVAPNLSNM